MVIILHLEDWTSQLDVRLNQSENGLEDTVVLVAVVVKCYSKCSKVREEAIGCLMASPGTLLHPLIMVVESIGRLGITISVCISAISQELLMFAKEINK